MYCPQCGAKNEDSARFCIKCGRDLAATSPQQPPVQQQQYQQPYQPAYQAPQYHQPTPQYGAVPHIPSYMGWAIATLILCFWPTGIVAVVHASRVNNRLAMGDYAGAQESSHKAKVWSWVTFGIGVGIAVIATLVAVFVSAAAINIY